MNYFQIINECVVRKSKLGLKIASSSGKEGRVLKFLKDEFCMTKMSGQDQVVLTPVTDELEILPIKIASFEFEYKLLSGKNICFAFGAGALRERLVEIPLSSPEGIIKIEINLKNKTIISTVGNKRTHELQKSSEVVSKFS